MSIKEAKEVKEVKEKLYKFHQVRIQFKNKILNKTSN
jgi:hypothetical protein